MTDLLVRTGALSGTPREIAARWMLREEMGLADDDRSAFEAWLAEDPVHQRAYDDARLACGLASVHAADPEIMAMRGAALTARRDRQPMWRFAAMAATAVLAVTIGFNVLGDRTPVDPASPGVAVRKVDPNSAVYRTAIGERSAISLPDGSVATLDTDSVLRVDYRAAERGVRLLRGQALFEVAKNRQVPFNVYAGGRKITAVGTVFNVRMDGQKVRVALIEGVVRVTAPADPKRTGAPVQQVVLAAGEVLDAAPAAPMMTVRVTDMQRLSSWTDGVVVFDDTRLADAVAEMNRYASRPIAISDPSLEDYRVSGVFKTGDPDRFARTVSEVFPIEVEHAADGAPTLRRKAS